MTISSGKHKITVTSKGSEFVNDTGLGCTWNSSSTLIHGSQKSDRSVTEELNILAQHSMYHSRHPQPINMLLVLNVLEMELRSHVLTHLHYPTSHTDFNFRRRDPSP